MLQTTILFQAKSKRRGVNYIALGYLRLGTTQELGIREDKIDKDNLLHKGRVCVYPEILDHT